MQLVSADPTVRGSRTMEAAVVQQLRTVAVNLVEEGVGFVGCQKCIHPTVKEYLREQVKQSDVSLVLFSARFFLLGCGCCGSSLCLSYWLGERGYRREAD